MADNVTTTRTAAAQTEPDLSVQIGKIRLARPVLLASGTCGYGGEYSDMLDFARIGGLFTKSITLEPRKGNAPPRTVETSAGMLNAIGLANVGLEVFCREKMPEIRKLLASVRQRRNDSMAANDAAMAPGLPPSHGPATAQDHVTRPPGIPSTLATERTRADASGSNNNDHSRGRLCHNNNYDNKDQAEACTPSAATVAPKGDFAIFVNVAGHSTDEYVKVCQRLDEFPELAGVELNVSCPNVSDGLTFGTNAALLGQLVEQVRRSVRRGLLVVKLSPNVTDICATAKAAIDAGADALSLVNTYVGMAININTARPILSNCTGGLSGPAIKPLAVQAVYKVYKQVAQPAGIPLFGIGGIVSWQDAAEFVLAGASAVVIGTGTFVDPTIPTDVAEGLKGWLKTRGCKSMTEVIGLATGQLAKCPSGAAGAQ